MFGFGTDLPDQWTILKEDTDLNKLISESESRLQLIFKHSTRCAISSMARSSLSSLSAKIYEYADLYYVDVIGNRRTSNEIAAELSVLHQSPQLIAVYGGEVVWDGSHSEVRKEKIEELIKEFADRQNPDT